METVKKITLSLCLVMVFIFGEGATAQTNSKEKQSVSSQSKQSDSSHLKMIESVIFPAIVSVDNGAGILSTGIVHRISVSDGKKASIVLTTAASIQNRNGTSILHSGVRAKAKVNFLDKAIDLAILQIEDTELPFYFMGSLNKSLDSASEGLFSVRANLAGRHTIERIQHMGRRRIGGMDFDEFSVPESFTPNSQILVSGKGQFSGIITSFKPSSDRVLALDWSTVNRYALASKNAEIIKAVSIQEKFHHIFGDDFVRWIEKGVGEDRSKHLKQIDSAIEQAISNPNGAEGGSELIKSMFEFAKQYLGENPISIPEVERNVFSLICEMRASRGDGALTMTFNVDLDSSQVNGYQANVSKNQITYSYSNETTTYNVRIDRVSGFAAIGSARFPILYSGSCRRTESRAF